MANQQEALRELALFAGAGGGILGGKLLGWRTVCAVEWDAYAASVLVARQNDGCLDPFPIWDDVQTFDGRPWRGIVDVVSGGFPCQDISCAGKGAGIDGERSGMWKHMARIIGEVRPRFVFVENSPMLTVRGLGTVLGDLAEMGYDARWGVFSALECEAMHIRERLFLVADSDTKRFGWKRWVQQTEKRQRKIKVRPDETLVENHNGHPRPRPEFYRRHNEIPNHVDRLKAIGNGQVPSVAKLAWETLKEDK
jgi:DNA (cytosine-5)-methyltransferase 1